MRAEAMPGENPATLPTAEVVADAFLWLNRGRWCFSWQRVNARDLMDALGTWPAS